ncbi:MAG: hypothetical protein IKR97_08190 [Eubacterium sp.]|nr:hypothetical protein [Eubacterium sp.]
MKNALKAAAVIANLLCIVAGGWVCATLLFKLDSYFVFFIPGMTSAEALFFNMIMFVLGLAGLMFVIPMLADIKLSQVEFPTIWAILPLVIGIISVVSAFGLTETREKIMVVISSVLYFLLSLTLIYNGAKIFQSK